MNSACSCTQSVYRTIFGCTTRPSPPSTCKYTIKTPSSDVAHHQHHASLAECHFINTLTEKYFHECSVKYTNRVVRSANWESHKVVKLCLSKIRSATHSPRLNWPHLRTETVLQLMFNASIMKKRLPSFCLSVSAICWNNSAFMDKRFRFNSLPIKSSSVEKFLKFCKRLAKLFEHTCKNTWMMNRKTWKTL